MAGQLEQDLLYLERQYWQLSDPDALVKRLVALEQQLAQSWATIGFRQATTTGHPTGLCGGISLPDSIPFTDPRFSVSDTLDWDASANAWIKCVSGIVHPTLGTVFALHYKLAHSTSGGATVNLTASWASDGTLRPVASDCSTATSQNDVPYTNFTETCPPPTYSKQFVSSSSLTIRTLYQSNTAIVTVGPVAPS